VPTERSRVALLLLLVGVWHATGVVAAAQGGVGTVEGRVVTRDGRPVSGVEVLSPSARATVRTDSAGRFRLSGVEVGGRVIQARQIGFRPVSRVVRVGRDSVSQVELTFAVTAQRMEAVVVLAHGMGEEYSPHFQDFFDRARRGVGSFFTLRDIERAPSLEALLVTVPGTRVQRNLFGDVTVIMGRCGGAGAGRIAYYLDGVSTNVAAFSNVHPKDVAAMEVYRGASQLPPEAVGNACAAIYIWTRRT
jgi:hypothetical protein